jgi:hypothetical protein
MFQHRTQGATTLFNTERFLLDHFGTPEAIIALSRNIGIETPAKDTVRKWFERGSIPGDWWPKLLLSLEHDNGAPVSLRGYLAEGNLHYDIFG